MVLSITRFAKVAELADAPDLGSGGATRGGSIPPFRTNESPRGESLRGLSCIERFPNRLSARGRASRRLPSSSMLGVPMGTPPLSSLADDENPRPRSAQPDRLPLYSMAAHVMIRHHDCCDYSLLPERLLRHVPGCSRSAHGLVHPERAPTHGTRIQILPERSGHVSQSAPPP